MKLGFIGLGKMGLNMVHRLLNNKHELVVFDRSDEQMKKAESLGAVSSDSLRTLVNKLDGRKIIWMMVPAGKPVDVSPRVCNV